MNPHCGLNALTRDVQQAAKASTGRSPDLEKRPSLAHNTQGHVMSFDERITFSLHSGATARDSHPLPYSPRTFAGHPDALTQKNNRQKIAKSTRMIGGRYHKSKAKGKRERLEAGGWRLGTARAGFITGFLKSIGPLKKTLP